MGVLKARTSVPHRKSTRTHRAGGRIVPLQGDLGDPHGACDRFAGPVGIQLEGPSERDHPIGSAWLDASVVHWLIPPGSGGSALPLPSVRRSPEQGACRRGGTFGIGAIPAAWPAGPGTVGDRSGAVGVRAGAGAGARWTAPFSRRSREPTGRSLLAATSGNGSRMLHAAYRYSDLIWPQVVVGAGTG